MNVNKLNFIKNQLGDNYLYELNMDIDAENTMPAYEFYNTVFTQFELLFPKLNKQFEESIEPDIPDQDFIDMVNTIDIFNNYARYPKNYRCPRPFFSNNFKNKQTVILNQIKFKYGSTENFIKFLSNNTTGNTHGYNNKELLNHIKYIAKILNKQYMANH